jgi:hypothetical protein
MSITMAQFNREEINLDAFFLYFTKDQKEWPEYAGA